MRCGIRWGCSAVPQQLPKKSPLRRRAVPRQSDPLGGREQSEPGVLVSRLDLADEVEAAALLDLLDHYARDPMGGGKGLSDEAKRELVPRLKSIPGYLGGLAFIDGEAVGLVNCFFGFSTFAAKPLLNVHDIVVRAGRRGEGIGQALLDFASEEARQAGCCKLTLEVLSGNSAALRAYERAGFRPYALDPAAGTAVFLERRL